MELIKQWIEEIRAKGEEYASGYWTYRLSADMAEFRVNTPIIYNIEKFKHTVIKIGMILTRLSRLLEEENKVFHIQTFPHLEDLRIVAVIRFNINFSRRNGFDRHQRTASEKSDPSIIQYAEERASELNFHLTGVEKMNSSPDLQGKKKWYLLCSNHNNPFTWLNIGYFTEELLLKTGDSDSPNAPQILTGLSLLKMTELPDVKNCPKFIHAYIGF